MDTWQGWIRHLTSPQHLKSQSEGCPRIGDAHPDVLVIPGYARWKQISNLLTLASTQHGNTPRIENSGSTLWKLLRSSSGLARDDDDEGGKSLGLIEMVDSDWLHHCLFVDYCCHGV